MKKITKNDFYIIVFLPILFIIGNFLFSKCEDDYYKKLTHINTKDSIKPTLISSIFNNKGTVIINRKYAVSTHDVEYINYKDYIDFENNINQNQLQYTLFKNKNNDTIWFTNLEESHYFVLEQPKIDSTKSIGDMSIWEFIKELKK